MRVCWCVPFVLLALVGTSEASEPKYECTKHIQPFEIIGGSSLGEPTVDGESDEFIECRILPKAAVYVEFDFRLLKLGDGSGITSIKDCRNRGDDSSLGHIRITNGQNDKNPFTCSDIKINTDESETITWDERKPIVSPDNTLVFNLTKGGSSTFGEVEYVIYTNVTSCPDVEGGIITRTSGFNFTISCFGEQKGTNSSDVYTCVDGYWTQGGIPKRPSCHERELKRLTEEHEEIKLKQNKIYGQVAEMDKRIDDIDIQRKKLYEEVENLDRKLDSIETKQRDSITAQNYHIDSSYFGFTLLAIVLVETICRWIYHAITKRPKRGQDGDNERHDHAAVQPADDDDSNTALLREEINTQFDDLKTAFDNKVNTVERGLQNEIKRLREEVVRVRPVDTPSAEEQSGVRREPGSSFNTTYPPRTNLIGGAL